MSCRVYDGKHYCSRKVKHDAKWRLCPVHDAERQKLHEDCENKPDRIVQVMRGSFIDEIAIIEELRRRGHSTEVIMEAMKRPVQK